MYYETNVSGTSTTLPPQETTSHHAQSVAEDRRSELAKRQDQFAALAESTASSLYNTALRWTGNPAQADDMVQETLMCAWRNFDRFTIGTCFRAWVFQILRFVIRNRRRFVASRQVTIDFMSEDAPVIAENQQERPMDPFSTDWETVFPDVVDDALKHALDHLTPTQRTLALCIPLGGLSYQECADKLGIPLGTVMSRYARARARLQQELRPKSASATAWRCAGKEKG